MVYVFSGVLSGFVCSSRLHVSARLLLGLVQDGSRLLQRFEGSAFESGGLSSDHAPRHVQYIWLSLENLTGGVSRCKEVTNELMHLHPGTLTWNVVTLVFVHK